MSRLVTVPRLDGGSDQVMERLEGALDDFRQGEKVTQKNVWKHLDISPFDNSANE